MNLPRKASHLFDRVSDALEKATGVRLPAKIRIKPEPNPLEGFLLGVVGANIGLAAMTIYQNYAAKPIFDASPEADKNPSGSLDSISVVGKQHEDGESSTAAVGRLALEKTTGDGPKNDAMATALSYGVHWGFGMLMGGVYGSLRSGKGPAADLGVGLAFGAGLWALADEVIVPMLGLQEGPTKASKTQHGNRLAAHLLYGAGLALGTQAITHVWRNARSGDFDNFWNFDEAGLEEVD